MAKKIGGKVLPSDGGYSIKWLARVPERQEGKEKLSLTSSWGSRVVTPPRSHREPCPRVSVTACLHTGLVLSLQRDKESLEKLVQVVVKSQIYWCANANSPTT